MQDFYGLQRPPFPTVSDPRFVFETSSARAARLAIGGLVDKGVGLIVLEADPGFGKTTFLRSFQHRMDPHRVLVVFLDPLDLGPSQVARAIGEALQGPFKPPPSQDELNEILSKRRREGLATVLVVDRADQMAKASWKHLDMLAMMGAAAEPAVTIILAGRPPLGSALAAAKRSHARSTATINLQPFSKAETSEFLHLCLSRAGATDVGEILSADAIDRLFNASSGVPGRLVSLADCVLKLGASRREQPVTPGTVELAVSQASRPASLIARVGWGGRLAIAAGVCLAAFIGWRMLPAHRPSDLAAALPAPVPVASTAVAAVEMPHVDAPQPAGQPVRQPGADQPNDSYPTDVFLFPATRGDTLRKLYDVAYRNRETRPSFEQFRLANPGLEADQRLDASDLIAFPGPLGPNWH